MCSCPMVSKEMLAHLRKKYPQGTWVRLTKMPSEPRPVPTGTLGQVVNVDDIGTIHVKWVNGSSLGLVYGVDEFEVVEGRRS